MKIKIPTKQEIQEEQANKQANATQSNLDDSKNNIETDSSTKYITTSSGISSNKENAQTLSKVNINTATQTQLESLPGIGPSTATKIIEYRNDKGKFNSIEDVKNVSGIGDAKFEKIKQYISVK